MDGETLKPEREMGNLSSLVDALEHGFRLPGVKSDHDTKLVYVTEL